MFEQLIQQVAQSFTDNIVSILISMGIIIPIAAGLVARVFPKLKIVSQYGDTFGQKMSEYADDMYMFSDALKVAAPEVDNYLKSKYGKDSAYFATRAKVAAEQSQRFKNRLANKDPELLAASLSDAELPREPFNTEPGKNTKVVGGV